MTLNIIKEVLLICSDTAVAVLLAVAAALLIYAFKSLCNKLGITINSATMTDIISIISQVVKYLDQKYVDTIKKNSSDGTLTDYQKQIVKDKSITIIKSILNSEQVDFLLKKYNMEEIDGVLDILIESTIKDVRTNNEETIVINDTDDSVFTLNEVEESVATIYNPTSDELASLALCPGDCVSCTLSQECPICRLGIDNNIKPE